MQKLLRELGYNWVKLSSNMDWYREADLYQMVHLPENTELEEDIMRMISPREENK